MEGTQTFLDYFKHQWVERNFGWYEGYAPEVPSTNNGLESFNRYVKGDNILRRIYKRLSMDSAKEESINKEK